MAGKKKYWLVGITVGLLLIFGIGMFEPSGAMLGYLRGEKTFRNRPTTYWLRMLRDSDPAAQSQALHALEKGGQEAIPVLIQMFQAKDEGDWEKEEARRTAAEMLGRRGPEARDAIPALLAALNDPN